MDHYDYTSADNVFTMVISGNRKALQVGLNSPGGKALLHRKDPPFFYTPRGDIP